VRATTENTGVAKFRARLLVAMALLAFGITGSGLYFAQRKVAAETEHDLQRDFQAELASLHGVQEVRHAALAERCRSLVRRPRIHAALEDNALDLLYPSAKDELRDVMEEEDAADDPLSRVLHARFYRFLDAEGRVIAAPGNADIGDLRPDDEAMLALPRAPEKQQLGYLLQALPAGGETVDEVIAMPIFSSETGEGIAALALGFKPVELGTGVVARGMRSGIWLSGRLYLPELSESSRATVAAELSRAVAGPNRPENSLNVKLDGTPHRLFFKRLNPDSLFPPAYEVCIYPLTALLARQGQLRWQAAIACAVLLLGAVVVSHFLAGRLSQPVEKLAIDSAEDRAQRARAEAELERSARFSADASHQLKTPVTVLRAGLEELLALEEMTPPMREEVASLVHQTFRLTSIVEDLLLLSRMDAGRLQINFTPVDLMQLIDSLVDDLSALPDPFEVKVDSECPSLQVTGEKRYIALILQNLLENARKYNRPGGEIRIACREEGDAAILSIGNTGATIPEENREHIFERFHRGAIGENVPGHGLGLNLARELARLHGGDLRLARSDHDWTEFEVRFRRVAQSSDGVLASA
jgi:signal transduction histidine kinase